MVRAWVDHDAGRPVPVLLDAAMDAALSNLGSAVGHHVVSDVREAAVEVGMAVTDLSLRHQPVSDADTDRILFWYLQLLQDRSPGDRAAAASDIAALEAVAARLR